MKIGNIIAKIFFILFLVVPILIVCGIAIFGEKTSRLSANESYQKAFQALQTQGREAVLTGIYTGSIPTSIRGSVASYEGVGRGDRWDLCFYSREGDKVILFSNVGKEGIKEQRPELGRCKKYPGINMERWKIDSEEAVKIARDKAKELGLEKFIIVMMELVQKEDIPSWRIEFLPPQVGEKTTCLTIIINAETGGIIAIEKPVRRYIVI